MCNHCEFRGEMRARKTRPYKRALLRKAGAIVAGAGLVVLLVTAGYLYMIVFID